jgi:hypothetical protein
MVITIASVVMAGYLATTPSVSLPNRQPAISSLMDRPPLANAALPQLRYRRLDHPFPISQSEVITISDFGPGTPFTEVIPSWNVKNPGDSKLTVDIRGVRAGTVTKWYRMADWTLASPGGRKSFSDQDDADAKVLTDTLQFSSPVDSVDFRLTLAGATKSETEAVPRLDLLAATFSGVTTPEANLSIKSDAWGKVLEVKKRFQRDYPNGGVLCSATSTSMLLNLASRQRGLAVDRDVPDVVDGLWDPAYDGAGNWSFNAAFYGHFTGLRGYISRFASIGEVEQFISAGIPVAVSVDYNRLKGTPKEKESGHLVVLVGFTKDGNPVFNDPAVRDEITTTYKRSDFDSAWQRSGRAVYVFTPDSAALPASNGRWIGPNPR